MLRNFWMRPHSVVAGLIAAVLVLVGLIAAGVSACTSSGVKNAPVQQAHKAVVENRAAAGSTTNVSLTPRSYRGTSSAGGFLLITVTPASANAGMMSYADLSNHRNGASISYTVGSDGSYTISDPDGNLVSGYEIPGAGLVLQARKAGPVGAEDALIIAAETGQVTLDGLEGRYNTMRFRTRRGGISVSAAQVGAHEMTERGYSPFAAFAGLKAGPSAGFEGSTHAATEFALSQDGTYFTTATSRIDGELITSYYTGVGQGFFLAATPDGSVIGLPQAASAVFDSGYAGTYRGLYYQKTDVEAAAGGAEIATPIVDPVEVSINPDGAVTLTDATSGGTLAAGTLKPVSEARYLYDGNGGLADAREGMFTFRVTMNGMTQDFFAAFATVNGKRSMLFSSFWAAAGKTKTPEYNYFYGVGLKGM
jgi:hypothetical protein